MKKDTGVYSKISHLVDKYLIDKGVKATNRAIGELIGVSDTTIRKWKTGVDPSSDNLFALAKIIGISLDQIYLENNSSITNSRAAVEPEYATAEEVHGWSDVKRVLQGNQPVRIFRVVGDSMTPTLYDTDLLFCVEENNHEEIRQSYVYVVESTEHGYLTKRVVKNDEQTITISSDNKKYKTYPLILGKEVLSLWRVRAYLSWQLGAPIYDHQKMVSIESMLFDLKEKIDSL